MKCIYKYRIPFKEVAEVILPLDAKIIRVDGVDGAIWLWAVVDPYETVMMQHTFYLFKTGGEMPDEVLDWNYIGCGAIFIQMELMMYIFEEPNSAIPVTTVADPFDWTAVAEE